VGALGIAGRSPADLMGDVNLSQINIYIRPWRRLYRLELKTLLKLVAGVKRAQNKIMMEKCHFTCAYLREGISVTWIILEKVLPN